MLISLLFLLLLTFSGTLLTFLFAGNERLLWRAAVGNVVGSAIFGLVGFTLANFLGLYPSTVISALVISLLPLILLTNQNIRRKLSADWDSAKSRLNNANYKKALSFAYYFAFFVMFWFFFERAMLETAAGIFTGGSQNLGDLPFHLGAIFSFTEGQNFPPENPSFAGARFTYPFMADFLSACLVALGAEARDAMFVQNFSWAFSLLVILERFVFRVTNNRLAGKIAPALLFFSGGLGFAWFAKDFWQQGQGLFDFLMNLPQDYTIGEKFRWGNSLVVLFITQRSLLLGMPLTLMVLTFLWRIFSEEKVEPEEPDAPSDVAKLSSFPLPAFIVGVLAGTLPLIHLHSLVVLFVVSVFLLALKPERWRELVAFGIGVSLVALSELAWVMSGSATQTSEFIAWHFGWDAGEMNVIGFWLKNTGIFIPLLIFGIFLVFSLRRQESLRRGAEETRAKGEKKSPHLSVFPSPRLLLFYLPFAFLFIVSNTMKLAPWQWDNIKVLIYWFVGSLPFVAYLLAWLWQNKTIYKLIAAACFIALIFAGALDVWRVVSRQVNYRVFDPEAVKIAEQIKQKTAPNALFLNAPTYNSPVVLSGRRSLLRYTGHLSSHGINYSERESNLQLIYAGEATADLFLQKHGIDYVIITPEERRSLPVNEQYFQKFPVIAESGGNRVYKVK